MSPECQASTFPKGDKKNRPAVAVWPGGDIKRDCHARRLRFSLALLQEALLRSAGQGLTVLIDGLGFARFAPALRQKASLGRADQRLPVLIETCSSTLRAKLSVPVIVSAIFAYLSCLSVCP